MRDDFFVCSCVRVSRLLTFRFHISFFISFFGFRFPNRRVFQPLLSSREVCRVPPALLVGGRGHSGVRWRAASDVERNRVTRRLLFFRESLFQRCATKTDGGRDRAPSAPPFLSFLGRARVRLCEEQEEAVPG